MSRHRLALVSSFALLCGFEWEGPLDRLRHDLESPVASARVLAVRRLAEFPTAEVESAIVHALEDEALDVRLEAGQAAARLHLESAGPLLLGWMADPEAVVREEAARALGSIGGPGVAAALTRALSDARASVRRAALEGLGRLRDSETAPAVARALDDADAEVRANAAAALGTLGSAEIAPALASHAADDAPEVRAAVLLALGRVAGASAAPLLVAGLDDAVADVRLAAVLAIGRARADVASAALEPLVHDGDARIARAAVAALASLDADSALSAVIGAALVDATEATAVAALRLRTRRLPEDTVRAVAERLLGDEPTATRTALILVELSAVTSIESGAPLLIEAHRERRGGLDVLRALGASGANDALVPVLVALAAESAEERAAAVDALTRYFDVRGPDGRAVEPLVEALGRAAPADRPVLVDLVARTSAARATGALLMALDGSETTLRARIARALGSMDDHAGRAALVTMLRDPEPLVRAEAALSLGRTGGRTEVDLLLGLLDAEGPTDRHAVLDALGALGARVFGASEPSSVLVERLAARLDDDDARLADAAVLALGRIADAAACGQLRLLLGDVPLAREHAVVRALGRCLDASSLAALTLRVRSASAEMAASAVGVLGERGDLAVGNLVLDAFSSLQWPASGAASFAIARLARRGVLDEHAGARICDIGAASHDPIVRANVAVALAALGERCDGGPSPEVWLERPRSSAVRAAAARWLSSTRSLVPSSVDADELLAACLGDVASERVAAACASPALEALSSRADVIAYASDGRRLLRERWVTLGLADGTMLLARTDANGRLVVEDAPRGAVWIDVPENLPLEP